MQQQPPLALEIRAAAAPPARDVGPRARGGRPVRGAAGRARAVAAVAADGDHLAVGGGAADAGGAGGTLPSAHDTVAAAGEAQRRRGTGGRQPGDAKQENHRGEGES